MEMTCKLIEKPGSSLETRSVHTITVSLKRLKQGQRSSSERDIARAFAPFFPKVKEEGWWLIAGNLKTNDLMAMKRVNVCTTSRTTIDIPVRWFKQISLEYPVVNEDKGGVRGKSILVSSICYIRTFLWSVCTSIRC